MFSRNPSLYASKADRDPLVVGQTLIKILFGNLRHGPSEERPGDGDVVDALRLFTGENGEAASAHPAHQSLSARAGEVAVVCNAAIKVPAKADVFPMSRQPLEVVQLLHTSLPQPCIVLIHNPQPVHGFRRVEMPGVPAVVVQFALDFIQPLLGARVDGALVYKRQKRLGRLIAQRRGVAEHDVDSPAAAGERGLDTALDFIVRLLVGLPRRAAKKPVVLVDAVRAADGDAASAAKLVHLTVEGEEQVRVLALRHDRAAEALDRLVSECRRWTRLVVSVDAQQRYGHRAYVSLELFVAVVDAVIYARVAEDDQHVLARCAPVAAEARDALKAPVCVAGEVDVHNSL